MKVKRRDVYFKSRVLKKLSKTCYTKWEYYKQKPTHSQSMEMPTFLENMKMPTHIIKKKKEKNKMLTQFRTDMVIGMF